jgi:hypothetical protein
LKVVPLAATLFLSACAGGDGGPGHSPSPPASPRSSVVRTPSTTSLQARLSLDATAVRAGRPLHANLVLINNTGQPIPYCNGVANVGLAKPGLPFRPVEPASGCAVDHSPTIPVGDSRWPVDVLTRFQTCTTSSNPTPQTPQCVTGPNGEVTIPPLPAGRYHTVVVWDLSASVGPAGADVEVQVTN